MMRIENVYLPLIGASLVLMIWASHPPITDAEGEVTGQVSVECTIRDATGTHRSMESRYTVTGTCTFFNTSSQGIKSHNEHDDTEWTATGSHQPNTKATFETLTLVKTATGSAAGSVDSTMQCGTDPWRQTSGSPCRFVTRKTSPDLTGLSSMIYNDILLKYSDRLPLSVFLSPSQRAALNNQYQIAMASQQKFDPSATKRLQPLPPVAGSPTTGGAAPTAIVEAPRIIEPVTMDTPGVRVMQGQLIVKIRPPRIGGSPVTELEFTWLDAPTNQPYVNAYTVDTADLLKGYPVKEAVTRGQVGRWEVRARVSGRPVPGPWSLPVPFQLSTSPPSQFLKKQSPTSGFSIQQTPKKGMSEEPQIFLPQTTPSQGFQGGTGLLRSRGIEETESKNSGPDTEKKP